MSNKEEYRLAAIMFTDIQGFSLMMEKNEKETLELLKYHNELIIDLVKKNNGTVIKTIGDAFMVSFNNTTNAVNTSIEIQKELYKFNQRQLDPDKKLLLRIGVHLGDIYFFENDALGEGINIASRLQSMSKPGGICISKDVYNQVFNKVDAEFISLGKAKLKNISKEIYAFEIITDFSSEFKEDSTKNEDIQIEKEKEEDYSTKNKKELEDDFLEKMKNFNRRISRDWIEKYLPKAKEYIDPVIDKLIEKGVITKIEKENGQIEYAFSEMKKFLKRTKKKIVVKDEINKFSKKAIESLFGIIPHSITFVITNVFLYYLNIQTSPQVMWSYIVALAWGNGLVNHVGNAFVMNSYKNKLNKNPEMSIDQYLLIKRDFKNSEGFVGDFLSFFGVNALLYYINITFSPQFHWFWFVFGGWGIGLISHFFKFIKDKVIVKNELNILKESEYLKSKEENKEKNKENDINENIDIQTDKNEFSKNKKIVKEKELTEFDKMLKNALSIREKLYKKLKSKDQYQTRYNLDIIQSIDDFILKIKELINLTTEIDEIIEANSNDEIDAYLIKLKEKLNTTENDELKREYNKSISQHEREKQSLIDLTNQKEIIYLRITNALSSLKQLEIDFTRIKGVVTKENDASVKIFTETSLELSNYVDNIKQSYQNLERTLE
ncbi:MAG TPA: adenylate/guanylate cyclase domain-containing protein [Spirochaetota bacterium]|nr:adenylate/guanylate cyclase domain-containing protein [Spirochaetota bacterium]